MAKMFYTVEEVCQKLGKTEEEVKEMARSGQIQEFRDREKLMFKVDQIDLLATGDDDAGEVHLDLEDTSAGASGSGLALEESGVGLEESREATGISVFDTDHGLEDSGTGTDQTAAPVDSASTDEDEELSLESVGSGSGLLDLTRESDDTSLGAELLEEVYSGDENIEIPASASGLFEAAAAEAPAEQMSTGSGLGAVPMMVESYDGSGSGLGVGMMLGAMAALVCVAIIVAVGIFGPTPTLAMKLSGSENTIYIVAGAFVGGTILLGLIGWFIGKATEQPDRRPGASHRDMLLTRYGWIVWGPVTVVCAAAVVGLVVIEAWWAIVPVALIWLAVAAFFRDPIRRLPEDLAAGAMLSPADGRVSAVTRLDDHEATGGPAQVVRIFLSVADVHVNRAPCDGEVVATRHTPGRYLDARTEESARVNEANLITLRLADGRTMGVRQVAGKVARRIVCRLEPGQRLSRGEKFGMIRFGSTTELILPRPDDVEVHVAVGDRVTGGRTLLATLAPGERG